jgi:hypothetical protein
MKIESGFTIDSHNRQKMSKFSKRTTKRAMPLITEEELWDLLDFSYVTVRNTKQPRSEPWDNLDKSKVTVRKPDLFEPSPVRKTIDLLEPRVSSVMRVRKPLQELDTSKFYR